MSSILSEGPPSVRNMIVSRESSNCSYSWWQNWK